MSGLSSLEELWPGPLPEAERLAFLQLKPDRQAQAVARVHAMGLYERGQRSGQQLMEQLKLGKTQFYKLVRDWKAVQSLHSLVPHSKKPKARMSRLNSDVIKITHAVIEEHVNASPPVSETALIRIVQSRAHEAALPVPADESLRRAIARMTLKDAELSLASVARMAMTTPSQQSEIEETAEPHFPDVFGGRLLLDHSTLDLIVDKDGTRFRPTVSVVVDDATRLILSQHLIDHIPEPEDFLNILAFAAGGYTRFQGKGISTVAGLHPVLTMRNGLSQNWNELRQLAEKARFKFDIRRAPEPVFGHILRRSMITEIGGIRLLPRSTMLAPTERLRENDAGKPVIPWVDAPTLLDQAVADHNRERLKIIPDEALRGTNRTRNLRLNTERRDWLEYALAVFRDAWASH